MMIDLWLVLGTVLLFAFVGGAQMRGLARRVATLEGAAPRTTIGEEPTPEAAALAAFASIRVRCPVCCAMPGERCTVRPRYAIESPKLALGLEHIERAHLESDTYGTRPTGRTSDFLRSKVNG